jgi:hypothetical protein
MKVLGICLTILGGAILYSIFAGYDLKELVQNVE